MLEKARPIRYHLSICFGGFNGDTAGFDSSTPFIPMRVGDYFDHWRCMNLVGKSDHEVYEVTGVKHSFSVYEDEVCQCVEVCVVPAERPD